MRAFYWMICAVTLLTAGCWGRTQVEKGFSGALDEYREAVLSNQPRKAYRLLDSDTQQKLPYAQFEREWKTNRREMVHEARRMKLKNARMQAVIYLRKDVTATMVAEKPGQWRVEDAPGLRPAPSDPAQLIRMLVSALERRDFAMYLSLLSPAYQKAVSDEIEQKIKQIEKAAEQMSTTSGSGEVARIPLDATGAVLLVLRKVNGAWRVDGWESARSGKGK
ncbi:MAG: hypothetical protein CVU65_11650 [Deltaproteobacteria bacterium HGW-Deltaproteobacteria-22]|jgi:hypothetical protein|nr:MAG: hypothetical protein CVU65_11650 [Deltaproteobacteria bacterium HGW-Deltaproteobacteria-22]